MSRPPRALRLLLAVLAGTLALPDVSKADTCSGLDLAALAPFGVGTNPSAVASGDFNRDGKLDVAVVNTGTNDVSVLLGDGAGGFTPAAAVSTSGVDVPTELAAGDLDQDGAVDLVVTSNVSTSAKVLKGGGDGTFAGLDSFQLGPDPAISGSRVYLGRFTGDADLDLVVLDEARFRIRIYPGTSGTAFDSGNPTTELDLSGASEAPAGAALLDFDHDGKLDLAVAIRSQQLLRVYFGDGAGKLVASVEGTVGREPADVAAGDVDRDGWVDLVTADFADGTATTLRNVSDGGGGRKLENEGTIGAGSGPTRVALVDIDRDGRLELAVLDEPGARVTAFSGQEAAPYFDTAAYTEALPRPSPRGLAVGPFTKDGRDDFVTALADDRSAVVVENQSGTPCARSSFAGAPRSFLVGDRPVSSAAADFDGDGRQDLVVVTASDATLRVLRNSNAGFQPISSLALPSLPNAVATADVNNDGIADVVVARGGAAPGIVQVSLGTGGGVLGGGDIESLAFGADPMGLAIGDWNGDGAADVAVAGTGTNTVYVFLNDGAGNLTPSASFPAGGTPRAIATADFDGDLELDLAVANQAGSSVSLYSGNGDGSFAAGPVLAVGASPQGVAAADLNGDGRPDIATADFGSGRVSVLLQDTGSGGFLTPAVAYAVGTNPTAIALLDLQLGDPKPEIAVAISSEKPSLIVLTNDGAGGFGATPIEHAVRNQPQWITPIDADSDGFVDLAIPCSTADAVVVLLRRPPGPLVFSAAPGTAVHDMPHAAAGADFNGDGMLDLAVANSGGGAGGNSVSFLRGDGAGAFGEYELHTAGGAESIASGDFDGDGIVDFAVSAPGESPPSVIVMLGSPGGSFTPQPGIAIAGSPDELVAGDFDNDGDLDLAVADKTPAGTVKLLLNDGGAGFTVVTIPGVGNKPTSIVSGDFDLDGDLDLAVGNDDTPENVVVLRNNPVGSFSPAETLSLAGDTSPVSLAAGDFDGDGRTDLVAASFDADRLHVYRNLGSAFATTPSATFHAPALLQFVTTADVNRDGKPDLVSVGAGVSVLRGIGGLAFEPAETVVAGYAPIAAVAADFDRDGRPDIVAVNENSDDLTMLRSSACRTQRLEVTMQPLGCELGMPPYSRSVGVTAFDDGGNVATCASNLVAPSIVPGTGEPGAVLGGPLAGLTFTSGLASFVGANALTIDKPGRRYRLQFATPGAPPAQTRRFTLGPAPEILGPSSVCPNSSGTWQLEGAGFYDSYSWTRTPDGPPPFAFTPSVTLAAPPLSGAYQLGVEARVDACVVNPTPRDAYFGVLGSVTLQTQGVSSVCVDCIGGSAQAVELGGGTIVSRQWGYRVSTTGAITPIPGETFDSYTLKGASFPGPGTYYVVVTSTPTCGAPLPSNEWTVTVSDAVPGGEVQHLAATSRGTSASGRNRLQWVNSAAPEEVRIRWNKAPTGTTACLPPGSFSAPFDGEAIVNPPSPSAKDSYDHNGLELDTAYCYSVFVRVSGVYSPGRTIKARPFDATAGPVKWAYATGGTAVAPPSVSEYAILAPSNDRTVHALNRGSSGGDWPGPWMPAQLVGVAHSRSPVVPFAPPLAGFGALLFTVDDASPGNLHAVDALSGNRPWPPQSPGLNMMGAPSGMFVQFGGIRDLLFVGTRESSVGNAIRAIDLATGTTIESYTGAGSPGPIGPINGSAAIDYATRRLYLASHEQGGGDTLFCLEILPAPGPVFSYLWSRDLGNISGSPVLRGGRIYVGNDAGTVYSLDAATGGDDHVYVTGDGAVKGFIFPDRRNDDILFATTSKVWSLSDDAVTMTINWSFGTPAAPVGFNPSLVLFRPGTSLLYVGSRNGELYQLDFTSATPATPPAAQMIVLGGGAGQIGAPSLDIGVSPPLLIVGSESGVLYGVELPLVP